MSSLLKQLTADYNAYLDASIIGLSMSIDYYEIDYSRGETDEGFLLGTIKKDVQPFNAMIALRQRLLFHDEGWAEFRSFTKEDIYNATKNFLQKQYEGTTHEIVNPPDSDPDKFLYRNKFSEEYIRKVYLNFEQMDTQTFIDTNPLTNGYIISLSKTVYSWASIEYLFETEHYYMLYYWYTTA